MKFKTAPHIDFCMSLEEALAQRVRQYDFNNPNDVQMLAEKVRMVDDKAELERKQKQEQLSANFEQHLLKEEVRAHNFNQMLLKMINDKSFNDYVMQSVPNRLALWRKNGIPNGFYLETWLNILNHENPPLAAYNFFNSEENLNSESFPLSGYISSSPFKHELLTYPHKVYWENNDEACFANHKRNPNR